MQRKDFPLKIFIKMLERDGFFLLFLGRKEKVF